MLGIGCSGPSGDAPRPEYNPTSGRLTRLAFDANHNGRNDSVSVMDGTRIIRVELDLDENGHTERWDYYRPDGSLDKVGFASRNDGVQDSIAYYDAPGVLGRIETSTARDGHFNRTEFYEQGTLVRSQEDTNGDGVPDKWETYRRDPAARPGESGYSIATAEFDDRRRGTPTRRITYAPDGSVARVEDLLVAAPSRSSR